jgi:signal transduction histidine kinase
VARSSVTRVTVDTREPVWVDADETRVEQVVTNLVGNAVKFTPPVGTIAISVTTEGAHVTFSVQDTGIGIPADALPRIFDLFAQGERTLDRSQGGLGIGLTLARRLVELHGGTIEARSDGLDRGSVFSVRLPVIAAPVLEVTTPSSTSAFPGWTATRSRSASAASIAALASRWSR